MILVLLSTISVILNIYVLWYIFNLQKNSCECALSTSHQFIKWYLIISITCNAALLYLYYADRPSFIYYEKIYFICFIPASILYAYITYKYVIDLESRQCECSSAIQRGIMWFEALVISIIYSFGGLWILVGGAAFAAYMQAHSKKK